MYDHWFISRQKRQLTQILPALVAFSDICVGKKWAGNTELQLKFEDELARRSISSHGTLRARKENMGGGGVRTIFTQMKDLGLAFAEDETKRCRLTLIGEQILSGDITFVEAMRIQLKKYQYPSATRLKGSGCIDQRFKVHPFQFLIRLLLDQELEGYLTIEEIQYIIIFHATKDSDKCYNKVKKEILEYRETGKLKGDAKKFNEKTNAAVMHSQSGEELERLKELKKEKQRNYDIANTVVNYLAMTQFIDQGRKQIRIRYGKEEDAKKFVHNKRTKFIGHLKSEENYIRAYGCGTKSRDLRRFDNNTEYDRKDITEKRITHEYILLAMHTPITKITSDVVESISNNTGIDEKVVEKYLIQNYSDGNIDDFFLAYKEMAHMGRARSKEFELATVEVFNKIFDMKAKHLGQMGAQAAPDVYVESESGKYCGIIDNKAYSTGYSITGAHRRVMEDEYIPHAQEYFDGTYPLAFFMYLAGSFKDNIDDQIARIHKDTNVDGSAVPVDLFINMAQDCAEKNWDHETLRQIFSVNREVRLSDIS